eukprot:11344-Hanusia_phi.AAC.3
MIPGEAEVPLDIAMLRATVLASAASTSLAFLLPSSALAPSLRPSLSSSLAVAPQPVLASPSARRSAPALRMAVLDINSEQELDQAIEAAGDAMEAPPLLRLL